MGPKSLLLLFSFHVPEKFGFSHAEAVHAIAKAEARTRSVRLFKMSLFLSIDTLSITQPENRSGAILQIATFRILRIDG